MRPHLIHCITLRGRLRPPSGFSAMVALRPASAFLGRRLPSMMARKSLSPLAQTPSALPQPCTTTSLSTAMLRQPSPFLVSAMLTTHGPTCFETPSWSLSLRSGLRPHWITSPVTASVSVVRSNFFWQVYHPKWLQRQAVGHLLPSFSIGVEWRRLFH